MDVVEQKVAKISKSEVRKVLKSAETVLMMLQWDWICLGELALLEEWGRCVLVQVFMNEGDANYIGIKLMSHAGISQ